MKVKTGWSEQLNETQDMIGNVGAGYDNTVSHKMGCGVRRQSIPTVEHE